MTLSRFVKYKNSGVLNICMPERVNSHGCPSYKVFNVYPLQ